MATIKKLPSGSWRAQVYLGKDKDGKPIRRSITRPTKKEALDAARQLEASTKKGIEDIDIKTAIKNYIDNSENTLSASTIAGYRQMANIRFTKIEKIKISEFNSSHARGLINEWSKQGIAPKTIKNAYNFLHAVLKSYIPDISLIVTLPKKKEEDIYIPSDADIRKLLDAAAGTSADIPIKLAAFCSLRRGEIAALTTYDFKNGYIVVSHSKVRAYNGDYVTKGPKTEAGYRKVKVPDFLEKDILDQCPFGGPITNLTPNGIYKAFVRARDKAGLPPFRFHALRHYFASSLHALGIPDKYIMEMGGWDSSEVLTRIYQHTMKSKSEDIQDLVSDYFAHIME